MHVFITIVTYMLLSNICNCKKRLLMDNEESIDSRFHNIELTIQGVTSKIQGLTSQLTEKEHFITQLQSTVIQLQSTISQLQHGRNKQSAQIIALQNEVNTKKQGCQTGSHKVIDADGHAHAGSTVIHFNPPFDETPKIVWGATLLDIDHNHNTRITSSISSVTKTGFTLNANTWSDTGLYKVAYQWMACPAHI